MSDPVRKLQSKTLNPLQELKRGLTRDQQIVICYRAGNTVPDIAEAFQLTKQRIQQILQAHHVTKQDNPKTRNRQLYAFIGSNVTVELKEKIIKETRRRKMSISQWVSRLIQDELSHNMGEEE